MSQDIFFTLKIDKKKSKKEERSYHGKCKEILFWNNTKPMNAIIIS